MSVNKSTLRKSVLVLVLGVAFFHVTILLCSFRVQAIRDGVIEATIDHEQGFVQSKVWQLSGRCDHFFNFA